MTTTPPPSMIEKMAEAIWLAHPMAWEGDGVTAAPWELGKVAYGDEYRRAGRDALKTAWEELCKMIVDGPLPGSGCDESAQRNGIVLACNHLFLELHPALRDAALEGK